jgi:DnaA family protein
MQQLTLSVGLNDEAAFDSFYTSDANKLTLNTLSGSLRDETDSMIYLYGSASSGRSHLLQAVCREADVLNLSLVYLPLADMQLYNPADIFEGLESQQVLCLDDIDVIAGNDLWEREVFNLYNRVLAAGGYVVASANCAPKALALKLPDLQSRLAQFLVLKIQPLTDDAKQAALQLRAKIRGMQLDDEVVAYMLRHGKRDMTYLIECLDKLDKASLNQQRRITIPFAKQVLPAAS